MESLPTESDLLNLLQQAREAQDVASPERRPPEYGPLVPEYEQTVAIRRRLRDSVPPLFCTLVRKPGGVRYVTVSEGRVSEVVPRNETLIANPTYDDGVIEHEIDNIWEGNLLKEHGPISVGQVVGVAFNTTVNGYITGKPMIEVRDFSNRKSTHFNPEVGTSAGFPGDHFVVLARLLGTGDAEKLEVWHGGNDVEYYHDTPPFKTAAPNPLIPGSTGATGADIFKQYNLENGVYEYRGLLGIDPISVVIDGDDVEFSLTGFNHDLTVRFFKLTVGESVKTYIDIPALSVTGTTSADGGHTHTLGNLVAEEDGSEHNHIFSDYLTDSDSYIDHLTGTVETPYDGGHTHTIGVASGDPLSTDGEHSHTVTGTTVEPTGDDRPYVMIPGAPALEIDTEAGFRLYCYRLGQLVGVYQDGVGAPALPEGGTTSEFAVWKTT